MTGRKGMFALENVSLLPAADSCLTAGSAESRRRLTCQVGVGAWAMSERENAGRRTVSGEGQTKRRLGCEEGGSGGWKWSITVERNGDTITSQATTASTSSFVTSLVFNLAVFGAEIVAFTILRRYFKLIYEPRSLSVLAYKRQQPLSSALLGWPLSLWNADYRQIKNVNGLDAYFFVRFLRMMIRVLLPIWLLSWIVLLPATSVKNNNSDGLSNFTFGNISPTEQARYWAHLVLAWVFTIWIWWNIKHEYAHFINVRQHFLVSPAHSASAQARTILVTGIPPKYLSELALHKLFAHLPGGVARIWLNRDLGDMPDLYSRRLAACNALESAQTSLISTAIKRRNKKLKKDAKKGVSDSNSAVGLTQQPPSNDPEAVRGLIDEFVPAKKRPTRRLPVASWMPFSLPLLGKKVDTIEWAREEIRVTNEELAKRREILARDIEVTTKQDARAEARARKIHTGIVDINVPTVPLTIPGVGARKVIDFKDQTYPPANGAFILFNRQIAAHMAVQTLTHHMPYRMAEDSKYVEVSPEDIIWDNLGMNPYERRIRTALSWAATIGLILVWAIPVAFVGTLSNIKSLCTTYSWLGWLCGLPSVAIGLIQGVLPAVLLAVLFMLLPIILRLFARFEGIPQRTSVELSLMDRFFIFLVIHGFLIVTISSGLLTAVKPIIDNPTSVPTLLAQKLPNASTFFLTYVILQGLSGTAGGFLRIVALVIYYVKLFLLGSTPRSVYNIKYSPVTTTWGTLFPQTCLIAVITLGYMIISPIINGLAWATFVLFYFLYKYLYIWVNDEPSSNDTGGLFFPKGLRAIFVGLYIQQICLCALFFLARDANDKASSIPQGALMVVLIIFTAFFHHVINDSYSPLIRFLPLSLADRSYDPDRVSPTQAAADAEAAGIEGATTSGPVEDDGVRAKDYAAEPISSKDVDVQGTDDATCERAVDEKETRGSFAESRSSSPSPSARPVDPEVMAEPDFSHPAAVSPQQIIWLARDDLGLAAEAASTIASDGIDVTTDGAKMDAKGHVDISSAPPEETRRSVELARARSVDYADEEPHGGGFSVRPSAEKAA
ncbi:hypothetical protein K488DRAFT_76589 [Vararia minispora EC-137]|uniref:Uncharacterized protein n=1 Tax=Vararia minispora EC-137 TaxID=1314806 RepID=A0ACB8QU70_9AGAM|nr:hypothetical protein K488DRAFT_76589 [Vararia minispora EC-137]